MPRPSAAQTWSGSSDLRARLTAAASKATIPVFFLQAENDYDLAPNRVLSEEVRKAGKSMETKTYPAFGSACAPHCHVSRTRDQYRDQVIERAVDDAAKGARGRVNVLQRAHDQAIMDTRRWGPGERIVFEPYTAEAFAQSRDWIAEREIFEGGKSSMGTDNYTDAVVRLT